MQKIWKITETLANGYSSEYLSESYQMNTKDRNTWTNIDKKHNQQLPFKYLEDSCFILKLLS